MGKVLTGILIALWWICSIWANVYSKKVFFHLRDFALQLTFAQTTTAVVIVGLLFDSKLFKGNYFTELIDRISIKGVIILSVLHAFGNLFTNVSMESANVAFTHTIKAAEPIFTIYFSRLMGKHEPFSLYLATLPVMLGVAISSLGEIHFSVLGFVAAVLSNSCFAYRNVSVKKLDEGDNLGIFFLVSCGSSIILAILHSLRTTYHEPAPEHENFADSFFNIICASVLHCSYNIFSFLVLDQVNPLTHAVINLVKRGAVIFVAILTFATPVNVLNMIGILTTLGGGGLFSFIKLRLGQQQKKPAKVTDEEEGKPPSRLPPPRPSFFKMLFIIGFVALAATVSKPASMGVTWGAIWDQSAKELNPCTTEDWKKELHWETPHWVKTDINTIDVPIIAMFGYTALHQMYHFGQYGATYIADRELRSRFGEDAIIIPLANMVEFDEARLTSTLELAERVVYNWEGVFHGTKAKPKQLVNFVKEIAKRNVPTWHINIAWYVKGEMETEMAEILNGMTSLEHLSGRDVHSYEAMQKVGLKQAKQAADLTFLLPFNFSCEVNHYFTKKNQFWGHNGGDLKVLVTYTSSNGAVRNAIEGAIKIMTNELQGRVDVRSIMDPVHVDNRSLEFIHEETVFEAMWLLRNADLVITGRFHCGTFSRMAGVPTVFLPGNTYKVAQLSMMIDSPAYPMVPEPKETGKTWAQVVWEKAKEALAYAQTHSLDNDGRLEKLHKMSSNNFPHIENDRIFNNRIITMEELERQVSFQSMAKNLSDQLIDRKAPPRVGISYNTELRKYILHELV